MPLEIPYDDLQRDFVNCVVMYKNKPVYVNGITRNGDVIMLDLASQREEIVPFTIKTFDAPVRRVGFVNCQGSVVYVSRIPQRKYYMGLNAQNSSVKTITGIDYENRATKARIQSLCVPELADAIMNRYPDLEEACRMVKVRLGAVAFDSQFCVSSKGKIYYKGAEVGKVALNKDKASNDIVWNDGKKYLSILLDDNHEKTVRDFSPSSR